MAKYTGQYQIGGNMYDIDPAWSDILYGPISLQNITEGFQTNPSVYQPAPTVPQAGISESTSYLEPYKDLNSAGGDQGDRQAGIDPNGGGPLGRNLNYSSSDWWGGDYEPGVTLKDMLNQGKSTIMSGLKATGLGSATLGTMGLVGTVLNSFKADPINDKTLQKELASYLESIGSPVTIQDFTAAYKELTKRNTSAKMNMTDTIQGLAWGLDPKNKDAYQHAIDSGFNPDAIGRWSQGIAEYNTANPMDTYNAYDMTDPRAVRLGMTNTMNPFATQILNGVGVTQGGVDRQQARNAEIAGITDRRDSIVKGYGYDTYNQFRNDVLSGTDTRGQGDGSYGSKSNAQSAESASARASRNSREGIAASLGERGEGGGYGGGSASGGDSDGDSSNNGNGQHE